MKPLSLFLLLLLPGYGIGQASVLSQTQLEKLIREFPYEDNQYFDCRSKGHIMLYTILESSKMLNKDSLFADSRLQHQNLKKYCGSVISTHYLHIAYIGKLSDSNNLYYNYHNNQYIGDYPPYDRDTLTAKIDNWQWLGANKYVRVNDNKISFHVIISSYNDDELRAKAELTALRFLVDYLQDQFRAFETMEVVYHDRFGFQRGLISESVIDNLVMINLKRYLNDLKRRKQGN